MAEELKGATYESTPVLSKVKVGNAYYYLKDADARAVIDIIYNDYLDSEDKEELQGLIDTLEAQVGQDTDEASAAGSLYARIKQEIADRSTAITTVTNRIAAEETRATGVEAGLQTQIDAIKADAAKVAEGEKIISKNTNKELQTTLNISIEKISDVEYIVLRGVGGEEVTKVDATRLLKDGMIDSVNLDTSTPGKVYLVITFNTAAGKDPIRLDVSTLIDVYTAGEGLKLTGHEFSVEIDEDSEDFLSVSANGVKLSGIQEAINAGRDAAKTYAESLNSAMDLRVKAFEADGAHDVAALEGRVSVNESAISGLGTRLTAAEGEIDALQADTHTHSNKTVLDGITSAKVSNWDEAYSKEHDHDNKAVLDGITAAKVSAWDSAEQNAKDYADGKVSAEATARGEADTALGNRIAVFEASGAHDVAALETQVGGIDTRLETAEDKLAGIETGAQVNKIEHIKMNGADLEITDKRVDLGSIASDSRVTTLEGRVDDVEDRLDVIEGTGEGSISKAKSDAIDAAKEYTDDEIAAVEEEISTLSGAFADHTHSVTASGTITPNLTKSEKHLGVSTGNSDEFVKEVTNESKGLVVAQYVNEVTTTSTTINGLTASVNTAAVSTDDDYECLILTPGIVTFNAVANNGVSKAAAATGELSNDAGLTQVVTSIDATSKGTAIGSVSLTNTGNTGIAFVESVAGVEQTVNVTGTAAKVSE